MIGEHRIADIEREMLFNFTYETLCADIPDDLHWSCLLTDVRGEEPGTLVLEMESAGHTPEQMDFESRDSVNVWWALAITEFPQVQTIIANVDGTEAFTMNRDEFDMAYFEDLGRVDERPTGES
ncbi:MAG: hypothetical protein Q4G67_00785 [Actinomycetia bacterium]|nr:hypothetical protein [Actinomycetes bacterium]